MGGRETELVGEFGEQGRRQMSAGEEEREMEIYQPALPFSSPLSQMDRKGNLPLDLIGRPRAASGCR